MPRPLAFNKEEKLQQAMLLFWQNGFDGTSIQDLVDKLKINKFSLYNTFGDKQTLYHEALKHYEHLVVSKLIEPLHDTRHSPLERISHYFRNLAERLGEPSGITGCFMQNAGLETAHKDQTVAGMLIETLNKTERAICDNLTESLEKQELDKSRIPAHSIEALARFLVIQAQGFIVYRKAASKPVLIEQAELIEHQLNQWRRM